MAKSKAETDQETEILPDAWGRFERAVDAVAKSGPQHRIVKAPDASRKPMKPKSKTAASTK